MKKHDILLLNYKKNEWEKNLNELNETCQKLIKAYSVDPSDYRDLNVFFDCDMFIGEQFGISIVDSNCMIFDFPKLLADLFSASAYTDKSFQTFMSSFVSKRSILFTIDSKHFKKHVRSNEVLAEYVGEDIDKFFDDLLELDKLIRKAIFNNYNIFYFEKDIDELAK
ncbi:MAG: hypothetical protein IKM20_02100 [Erysipelotrichales bacterium]|nr:hypothetical protein [Erysipelotrichales bacterium]